MAEKNSAPDVEYNDDGTKNPDYVAPKTESESVVVDTENKDKEEGEFDDIIDPNKPPEIPVRQFNAQHIIARKNEKIKKLEAKLDENGDPLDDEDDAPEESVEQIIDKKMKPVLDILISKADEDELKSLVKDEPEAAKYENHIKAYMSHDAYKGVSPTVIYHHLAWQNAQAIGAKKKQVADLEANQSKGGGRNLKPDEKLGNFPSPQDIADMSEADFEKMQNEALQK